MFALVDSGHYENDDLFDPEAEEKRQYADYDDAINDTEIVSCVAAEPLYEDTNYAHEDHTDPMFDDCRVMWPDGGPMPHEKAELEFVYFTGSDMGANIQGYNPDTGMLRAGAAREETRRPTSNAPSNLTQDSLDVVVKRVRLLLGKPVGYVQSVIDTFGRLGIRSCHALFSTLENTRCDCILSAAFTRRFEASSRGLVLCHKQLSFFRCASMYMTGRWKHDHEDFQRMIEWEQRSNIEAVGAIITNLHELFYDEFSSDDGSMPGLQERGREDSLSSDGSGMPHIVPRGPSDSSSDDNTESITEVGMYDDEEPWGCKSLALSQIIGGNSDGLLLPSCPTLFAFSLHGYSQVKGNHSEGSNPDFYQAKE